MNKYKLAQNNRSQKPFVKNVDSDKELLQKLKELVLNYPDYRSPCIQSDGEIIISLDPSIKRKRQTTQNFTDAIKLMMNETNLKRPRK